MAVLLSWVNTASNSLASFKVAVDPADISRWKIPLSASWLMSSVYSGWMSCTVSYLRKKLRQLMYVNRPVNKIWKLQDQKLWVYQVFQLRNTDLSLWVNWSSCLWEDKVVLHVFENVFLWYIPSRHVGEREIFQCVRVYIISTTKLDFETLLLRFCTSISKACFTFKWDRDEHVSSVRPSRIRYIQVQFMIKTVICR